MRSWLPDPSPDGACLVTGASSGIGRAVARRLAAGGRGVILVGRREDRLRELAGELSTPAARAEWIRCDLADAAARTRLAGEIESLGLRVDVLVNSAGLGSHGPFSRLDPSRELEQVRVGCEAVVDLCGAFVPAMATRRRGAVLIVSSGLGFQPVARQATYGAGKAFGISFGDALHAELRPEGVAVCTVCPGPVETEFFVANGPNPAQGLPRFLWRSADQVAAAAIGGLEHNRRVVIPGAPLRALISASRLTPPGLRLRVVAHALR
jgi:short-subunit dehydrogenase